MPSWLFLVDGENLLVHGASGRPTNILDNPRAKGTWKYGTFGEANPDVAKATGKTSNNVEMIGFGGAWNVGMVLSDDGKTLTFFGMTNSVDIFNG